MEKFIIDPGRRLSGEIKVQGAKNSILPILAAALAVGGVSVIHNCPRLCDVEAELEILRLLGCGVAFSDSTVTVDSTNAVNRAVPEALMSGMRSSVIFLGALLSRFGSAEMSIPGGCKIGRRPIDYHVNALEAMGAQTECAQDGALYSSAGEGLHSAVVTLPFPSVGATENLMIAAAKARGETVIGNAAREPEIADLARFLNLCGADIKGAGTDTVYINGVKTLSGCEFSVVPDRIMTATFMAAAAVTGGRLKLLGTRPDHLGAVTEPFRRSGCRVRVHADTIDIKAPGRLNGMGIIRTQPYPGFPTDCQAVFTAMAAAAKGDTVIVERVFENRFMHIGALRRMGAAIETENNTVAIIEGRGGLRGAVMDAPDLRGGMALCVAALAAGDRSEVGNIGLIDRGCESFEGCLSSLGADIKRVDGP